MPAKSEDQQIAARLAYLAKKGKYPHSKLRGASLSMFKSMSAEELHKFAFGEVKK